jgi:hypothetical protein
MASYADIDQLSAQLEAIRERAGVLESANQIHMNCETTCADWDCRHWRTRSAMFWHLSRLSIER